MGTHAKSLPGHAIHGVDERKAVSCNSLMQAFQDAAGSFGIAKY